MDNFYSSLDLANFFCVNNFSFCGTLRKNKVFIPKELKFEKLNYKNIFTIRNQNNTYLAKYKDKKDLFFFLT